MAGKIQDRGQMGGVLASLKGAWKRVAGRKSDHSDPATAPERVDVETLFDDVPVEEAQVEETSAADAAVEKAPVEQTAAEAAPVYAVPDATPADDGVIEDEETSADVQPAEGADPAEAQRAAVGATVTAAEAQLAEELVAEAPAESDPVSEPLDVASEEAAKAPKGAKTATTAKAKKAGAAAPSPFIAPESAEAGPDSSWTVAQLRALAKERGVRGYSSMSKAQLLGALNGPQA